MKYVSIKAFEDILKTKSNFYIYNDNESINYLIKLGFEDQRYTCTYVYNNDYVYIEYNEIHKSIDNPSYDYFDFYYLIL